jgi:hypothetical protein
MRRLIILVLLALAIWFGWRQYGDLFSRGPEHRAVIENRADRGMTAVRLKVDGKTFEKESLPDGEDATFTFRVARDTGFELTWSWAQAPGQLSWTGGYVTRGPMAQEHVMTVDGDGSVIYRAETR